MITYKNLSACLNFNYYLITISKVITNKSILYSRIVITIALISIILGFKSINVSLLANGIGLFGGLFHATPISQSFHIFIYLISAVILQFTGFYPRKVSIIEYSSMVKLLFNKLIYYNTNIINKMGEQFKIIEYPLIILFIITGATFLVSSSDKTVLFLFFFVSL